MRFLSIIYKNLEKIIGYVFGAYSIFLIVLRILDLNFSREMAYLFWFLFGWYFGIQMYRKAVQFLEKQDGEDNQI